MPGTHPDHEVLGGDVRAPRAVQVGPQVGHGRDGGHDLDECRFLAGEKAEDALHKAEHRRPVRLRHAAQRPLGARVRDDKLLRVPEHAHLHPHRAAGRARPAHRVPDRFHLDHADALPRPAPGREDERDRAPGLEDTAGPGICTCMYICMYVCMYVCMHIYIYICR